MPLDNLYKKIIALEGLDIEAIIMSIIRENEETIVSLVRGQMGSKGTTGIGTPIKAKYGSFYSDITERNKRFAFGLGRNTDHVTMFMTGAFYSSLKMITAGTTFKLTSNVEYFNKINDAWNEGFLVDLDQENLKYFRDTYIIPQLKERIEIQLKT